MSLCVLLASMAALSAGCGATDDRVPGASGPGGTLVTGELEPDFLHPARQATAFPMMNVLFTPLLRPTADGGLAPAAARSVRPSPDRRVWTITLRRGWRFHDGTPIDAETYLRSWNAAATAANGFENGFQLAGVEGYAAMNPTDGKPSARTLSGLRRLSPYRFRVTLVAPDGRFADKLAGGFTAFLPLPRQAWEDPKAFNERPVGNGPYEMAGPWRHDREIAVRRFAGYRGSAGRPAAIRMRIYADLGTAYRDVQAQTTDITFVGEDRYLRAERDFRDQLEVLPAPTMDLLLFGASDERFADPRVRKAIRMAIDADAISDAFFNGLKPAATSVFSTAFDGARQETCDWCRYDPAAARDLLREAGGIDGVVPITYPSGSGYEATYQAIGNMLRTNLGLRVEYVPLPEAQFLERLNANELKGLIRGAWGSLYPSLQEPLEALFTPDGYGWLATRFDSPQLDALVRRGNAEGEAAARRDYLAAERVALDGAALAPLFYGRIVLATSARVRDLPAVGGRYSYADVVLGEEG